MCVGPDGIPLSTLRLENFRDGLEDYAYVKLNENAGDMLFLTSDNGNITVRASGYTTNVYNYADARGEAAAGGSYAAHITQSEDTDIHSRFLLLFFHFRFI